MLAQLSPEQFQERIAFELMQQDSDREAETTDNILSAFPGLARHGITW